MAIDQSWLKDQVNTYSTEELPKYRLYVQLIERIFQHACAKFEILGIVNCRFKEIPSFAEKAIRKSHKYDDPIHQLTDLCGARVITNTQHESDLICQFIRDNFRVDEENSLDLRTVLKAEEFGYRSVHYVIQLKWDSPEIMAIVKEMERKNQDAHYFAMIGDRRAEVQVRTLLQHAWAMISHDRFYKSDFEVPEYFRRELARVAALLESADEEFGNAVIGIDQYKLNYGAYMSRKQIVEEMEKWEMVLSYDQENVQLAHRIGQLALAMEDWGKAITILEPFRDSGKSYIMRDLGIAMTKKGSDGRKELQSAVVLDPSDAEAWCALGGNWAGEDDEMALEHFKRAFHLAPADPHILGTYLECRLRISKNIDFIPLMYPTLESAIETCGKLADAHVYLPWAFFDMAKFSLLLNRPFDCLEALTKAVTLSDSVLPIEMALDSMKVFEGPIVESLPSTPDFKELDWAIEAAQRFLRLAIVVELHNLEARTLHGLHESEREEMEALRHFSTLERENEIETATLESAKEELIRKRNATKKAQERVSFARERLNKAVKTHLSDLVATGHLLDNGPYIIVAGGCSADVQEEMEGYREDMETAFECFAGTVISGGSRAGISGIVGDLSLCSQDSLRKIGYIPGTLPEDFEAHNNFERFEAKETSHDVRGLKQIAKFTPLQPLQGWIDLLAGGIKPWDVRVLGINGGAISAFEYRMALSFGATVGILKSSGRSAAELQSDVEWWSPPNLLWLPKDEMAIRAFVNPGETSLKKDQLERVAKVIHNKYLEEHRYTNIDPAMMPWGELREDLRQSNRAQADYAEKILRSVGYGVLEAAGTIEYPEFSDDEIERMAEIEHGRWIVERLKSGWSYGPKRDPKLKKSPYLAPWKDLPEEVKEYDRGAVREYPECLRMAGLEVYKLD